MPIINNKATTQDSLNLYNNSISVQKYYNNPNYKDRVIEKVNTNNTIFKKLDSTAAWYEKKKKDGNLVSVPSDDNTRRIEKSLSQVEFRKNIDKNKFYQREDQNTIIDTRAPMQLFDRRIIPQKFYQAVNKQISGGPRDPMGGDYVSMYQYDPIVIKPAAMKTKQNWEYIRKNYPEYYPKTTTKPIVQKPIQPVVQPTVQAIQQAPAQQENWNTINSPISYSMNGKTMYSTQDKFGELFKDRIAFYKERNVSDEVANKLIEQEFKVRKKDTTLVPDDATQKAINVRATNLYKK